MTTVPETPIRTQTEAGVNSEADFVLYWMIANRRTEWNYSLQRAVHWARQLNKPLVVFEALRTGYRWANDRLHYFVIQGMADNAKRLDRKSALYYPYLEPELGAGKGLLAELARRACVVVSDDFPCFFLPGMLRDFIQNKVQHYESRNEPERDVASGLSPYLHFGHISAHQVFAETTAADGWRATNIAKKANGSSVGWWGASAPVESFLDELITWRELGYNMCWQRDDHDQYESLPDWAKKTLAEHTRDPREHVYTPEEFEAADTRDELWNAAQRQLVREGRIHNYLRMLWGKKILEWTASPRDALDIMIELNNKYALDGRNPNSYSGIFWVLGRYDRAWGPERPIFGKIRYMSSENTARKVRVKDYINRYGQ